MLSIGAVPVPLRSEVLTLASPSLCRPGSTGWNTLVIHANTDHGGSSVATYNPDAGRWEAYYSLGDNDPNTVWSVGDVCYGNPHPLPHIDNQALGRLFYKNGVLVACAIDMPYGRDVIDMLFFWCG